ncbi:FAD-dependent oxidoreductase [Streptomyces nitrosporeus]|uniref:FAD-dependent oxidoreductase n=1 Tax=Streptomyces nitrosporeus TaxID=28894 RepID=A0A5J6FFC0_9ACTN|nr:NAD(P)/FAD-dependent oxidoreductase [Streptomyces nitrosporeus]QEU74833.1 FAD-dependent oxidoreductase [Streptomyces nitrosporeus]GGZ26685.1 oxidoreductase [Streptomyces nitrosporeus]
MLTADTAHHADVVVIGAGIAGLTAAHQLISAGVDTCVLEAAPRVGGRMATDETDGFRLDRTGPLLSSSYPELRTAPGLGSLALREFAPGVLVHSQGRRYRSGDVRSARGALRAARSRSGAPRAPLGGAIEQARLGAWLSRLATTPASRILARPDLPALDALSARGLPPRTVDGFLRPLLAALLSDPVLATSSRCADLVLRSYARGGLCVPEGGASALPELLAAALPAGTVRTGVHVTGADITSVRTKEHGELSCRSLLLATGAGAAAELLPGLRTPDFHPVTVLHHTAPAPPPTGARLLLDADRSGPVSHTAVMSAVDPSRAPLGRTLITSTVLGPPPPDLDRTVRSHLATLYGTPTHDWELLAATHDPEAAPAMAPPHDLRRPVRVLAGLYVCGDHRDTSTVQGALHSGRRAAAAILADLGVRRNPADGTALPAAA